MLLYNVKPSGYCFYVNTKISVDFQICISVPFKLSLLSAPQLQHSKEKCIIVLQSVMSVILLCHFPKTLSNLCEEVLSLVIAFLFSSLVKLMYFSFTYRCFVWKKLILLVFTDK